MSENIEPSLSTKIQLAGVIIALLAVAVTVVFSIRAERIKEITVKHITKRQLVSIENGRANVGLEVLLGGKRIESPWLYSGRLENTGNQPIEERDIEAPTTLHFQKGKIVRADITNTSQFAITAQTSFEENTLSLKHKLLNPGDWINFDILFDGEPDTPVISARISGITQPHELALATTPQLVRLAVIPLPMPVIYLMLAISTLVTVAVGGALLIFSGAEIFRGLLPKKRGLENKASYADVFAENMKNMSLSDLRPLSTKGRLLYFALGLSGPSIPKWGRMVDEDNVPRLDILDNREVLLSLIRNSFNTDFLKSLELSPESAADLMREEIKESYKKELVGYLQRHRSHEMHIEAINDLQNADVKSTSVSDLFGQAVNLAKEMRFADRAEKERVDFGAVIFFMFMLFVTLSFIAMLGGMWRTLLGI